MQLGNYGICVTVMVMEILKKDSTTHFTHWVTHKISVRNSVKLSSHFTCHDLMFHLSDLNRKKEKKHTWKCNNLTETFVYLQKCMRPVELFLHFLFVQQIYWLFVEIIWGNLPENLLVEKSISAGFRCIWKSESEKQWTNPETCFEWHNVYSVM